MARQERGSSKAYERAVLLNITDPGRNAPHGTGENANHNALMIELCDSVTKRFFFVCACLAAPGRKPRLSEVPSTAPSAILAFLVAQAVVKSGLGQRIALFMVGLFGRSSLGLAYSIVLTDAAIAPAFPSNTARGGVLYPIVLSVAKGSGSDPDDPEGRRLGGYLMFCAMASLAVSSAL